MCALEETAESLNDIPEELSNFFDYIKEMKSAVQDYIFNGTSNLLSTMKSNDVGVNTFDVVEKFKEEFDKLETLFEKVTELEPSDDRDQDTLDVDTFKTIKKHYKGIKKAWNNISGNTKKYIDKLQDIYTRIKENRKEYKEIKNYIEGEGDFKVHNHFNFFFISAKLDAKYFLGCRSTRRYRSQ